MKTSFIVFCMTVLITVTERNAFTQLPYVAPADFSRLKPSDFADDELDMPYYIAHLHEVANAVVPKGENRRFIAVEVWRSRETNKPYNARILENHLSLAYFYCTRRPWNVYHGDPSLWQRLEVVLEYWCGIQSDDGRFRVTFEDKAKPSLHESEESGIFGPRPSGMKSVRILRLEARNSLAYKLTFQE